MNRRDLIRSAVLGASAASVAGAQRRHGQLISITPAQAATTPSASWTPAVLDEHQNETVMQLSELIIPTTDTPGGRAARVNEWVDLYLQDIAPDDGRDFLMGLGWLDGYAIEKHGQPFVRLSEADQIAILEALDGAEAEALQPGRAFFAQMKRLTVQGYYTSPIGIAELNKDGVPDNFACADESQA